MRTKRILLSLLLAVMVCSTGFVVLCGRYKKPKLQQQCKIELGQDRVTEVKEYGEDGFLCLINGTELRLMAYNGEVLSSLSLDEEVTLLATDDDKAAFTFSKTPNYSGGYIVAVCGGKNIRVIASDPRQNSLFTKMDFSLENTVVSAAVRDSIVYIVLDNGDLYGFDIPILTKSEVREDNGKEETSVDLKLICQNAKIVGEHNVVLKDNSYMNIYQYNTGDPYEPFGEEIIGVANNRGCGQIITSQAIYEPVLPTDIRKMQQIDNGQVYAGSMGYFYVENGEFYYTGFLNDPGQHAAYSPEAKQARVDIPSGYNYCCICRGIVCYDEHTIICYFV